MHVQAPITQTAVERLDEGIIRWFPGPREAQRDALFVRPLIQRHQNEFTAAVDLNPLWRTAQGLHMQHRRHYVRGFQGEIHRDRQAFPAKIIHYS